ncbi:MULTISPECIES: DUF2000 domain-containing protein [Vibrio harveyi group]|uniref:DUF2000 domain-containing protein n=1 Tax=Vibrio harveyi group TaxID=717610 RepID=UPI0006D0DA81|nr:conserved hypothetical protein [Vibrio rotiferianus]CAH1588468.1 conserved hypothetical protein [Vibrio rotiferianus]CAH1604324.1 conserved hypothetical protein [Vibrio jasicida]
MNQLPDEKQKRFVAVISKKVEVGRAVNVLGHLSVSLANQLSDDDAVYTDYHDLDGNLHPNISHYPFIVLRADNSNKIRNLRQEALDKGIPFSDFTHTMVEGGSEVQQQTTKNTSEAELEYLGICLFGETETLRELTKKFSLYR